MKLIQLLHEGKCYQKNIVWPVAIRRQGYSASWWWWVLSIALGLITLWWNIKKNNSKGHDSSQQLKIYFFCWYVSNLSGLALFLQKQRTEMTSLLKEMLIDRSIKLSSIIAYFNKYSQKNCEVVVVLHSNPIKLVIKLKKKSEKYWRFL